MEMGEIELGRERGRESILCSHWLLFGHSLMLPESIYSCYYCCSWLTISYSATYKVKELNRKARNGELEI